MHSSGTAPVAGIGTAAFYRDPYPTYRALLDSGTRAVRLAPNYVAVTRKNNTHLTFGAGAHSCLGLHLARLEAQIAFPILLARYPGIELCDGELEWTQTLALRGLKHLKVVLHGKVN